MFGYNNQPAAKRGRLSLAPIAEHHTAYILNRGYRKSQQFFKRIFLFPALIRFSELIFNMPAQCPYGMIELPAHPRMSDPEFVRRVQVVLLAGQVQEPDLLSVLEETYRLAAPRAAWPS